MKDNLSTMTTTEAIRILENIETDIYGRIAIRKAIDALKVDVAPGFDSRGDKDSMTTDKDCLTVAKTDNENVPKQRLTVSGDPNNQEKPGVYANMDMVDWKDGPACEWCDNKQPIYRFAVSYWVKTKMRWKSVTAHFKTRHCPMCGRRLEVEE